MTDFCISAVRYSANKQHIEQLRVHVDNPSSIGEARTVDRAFVADLIRLEKATFQTVIKNPATQKWKNGAPVHVIDDVYLSTDRNSTKKDNLGNLPVF